MEGGWMILVSVTIKTDQLDYFTAIGASMKLPIGARGNTFSGVLRIPVLWPIAKSL